MIIDKIATGERIAKAVCDRGMTLSEFGRKINMPHSGVYQIIRGIVLPSATTLIKMSVVLGVSTDWILGLVEE